MLILSRRMSLHAWVKYFSQGCSRLNIMSVMINIIVWINMDLFTNDKFIAYDMQQNIN